MRFPPDRVNPLYSLIFGANHVLSKSHAIPTERGLLWDSDFAEFAEMGPVSVPVVLIAIGNCSVAQMEQLLRDNADAIRTIFGQTTGTAGAYVVEL